MYLFSQILRIQTYVIVSNAFTIVTLILYRKLSQRMLSHTENLQKVQICALISFLFVFFR